MAATVTGTFTGGPQVVATTTYPGGSPSTTETLTGHATGGSVLLGGFVDWFPDRHGGWHLGGSLGIGVSGIRDDAYHDMTSGALGLGASGGYDWWLARSLSAGIHVFVLGAFPRTRPTTAATTQAIASDRRPSASAGRSSTTDVR